MAIRGSLREASLPDVLQLLSMGKKTGCLSVTHRNNFGYIYFDKGRISYASIVNRRDRIGDMLVKAGSITPEQLQAAIDAQAKHRDKRIGDLLVELAFISREALHEFVRVQIEEAVYLLFTWNEGTFNFDADVHPERQDLLVSISPESLLLEGARRVDEWSLIEKKIPGFDAVFDADWRKLADTDPTLSSEQQSVLQFIDGRRDVNQIVEATGLVEFEVGKALYGLLTAGLIHRVGRNSRVDLRAIPESRTDEHRNLGIAFYKTGMHEDALREFRRVLELNQDDAHRALLYRAGPVAAGQVERRPRDVPRRGQPSRRASGRVPQSGDRARAGRAIRRRRSPRSTTPSSVAGRDDAQDPDVHRHRVAADGRASQTADKALLAAKPLWPNSEAVVGVVSLCVSRGRAPRRLDTRTGRSCEEGLTHHPHIAALYNNLAALLERAGSYDEALLVAEHGLTDDPGMPQLHKNIGDLYYRASRFDEAFDALERAVKANPDHGADVYLKLGNIRLRRPTARRGGTLLREGARAGPGQRARAPEPRAREADSAARYPSHHGRSDRRARHLRASHQTSDPGQEARFSGGGHPARRAQGRDHRLLQVHRAGDRRSRGAQGRRQEARREVEDAAGGADAGAGVRGREAGGARRSHRRVHVHREGMEPAVARRLRRRGAGAPARRSSCRPNDPQSEALLGWALMLQEKYDDALLWFQKVLMREPQNALARINVGYICLKKRIFGEAIEHLSRAIRLDNDKKATLYAHFYLGLVYLERDMFEDAQTFFQKTLVLGPQPHRGVLRAGARVLVQRAAGRGAADVARRIRGQQVQSVGKALRGSPEDGGSRGRAVTPPRTQRRT